ncbi:MAG: D-inositol-3-phosphate glycosyltransferase [Anaerolineae bacterium]|nr:D-inositol-3-phosphate glycosyltransferase [Anaerolineae bacterium]
MRIAVNLLPFRAQLAGAGHYTQNLLRAVTRADARNEYIFFVTPQADAHFAFDAANVTRVAVNLDARAARLAYEQCALPIQLRRRAAELLFTPSVAVPLAWRGKQVTIIYDMIAEHADVTKYPRARNLYVRWMSRYAARRADAVITISENSRREIAQYARVPRAKIQLAYPAAAPTLARVTDALELQRVRDAYQLPERFILYLGTLEPGKNLPHLIRAYSAMKRARPELPQHLVLAGAQGWGVRAIEDEIQRSDATGFHLIGFVDESDVAALYSLADLFVYPSLYEGFGMPPLEAMACGAPVIVSNVSALPEVLGALWQGQRAGITVAPRDQDALTRAMTRVLTDDALAAQLRAKGLQRAQEFSWQASAQIVLDTLNAQAAQH